MDHPLCTSSCNYKSITNGSQQEELGIIDFNPFNILKTRDKIYKSGSLATTFHKTVGNKIFMSGLDMAHRQFANTLKYNCQDKLNLIH